MNQYEKSLYPMVPLGNDAVFDQYNIPFSHCDYRLMVNRDFADSYYQEYGNVQYHYLYTDNDLEDDLRGLDNEINAERTVMVHRPSSVLLRSVIYFDSMLLAAPTSSCP